MRRRHRLLVAAGLLAPACSQPAPSAHRGRVPETSPSAPSADGEASAGAGDGAVTSSLPAPATTEAPTTTEAPATTVTITVPTTPRRTTTTFAVPVPPSAAALLPENQPMVGPTAWASYYGAESGSRTADGTPFDGTQLVFAHKTMAFDTLVRFCGPLGCVVARCADRGPFIAGRTFDLSEAAFARVAPLGAGVAELAWEIVG